jgi:transcriptional regulator with XRE-family HTH domain
MERITKHIGRQLRAARLAKGMTQEALAGALGMATESISHIERGITQPSLKTVAAASEALGIGMADFFTGLAEARPVGVRRAEQEAKLRRISHDLDDDKLTFLVQMATAIEKLP